MESFRGCEDGESGFGGSSGFGVSSLGPCLSFCSSEADVILAVAAPETPVPCCRFST